MLLTAELLTRMETDAPLSRFMQNLLRSGKRMQELLDSLLDYSRSSLGRGISIVRSRVNLETECREELEVLRAALPERRIEFEVTGATSGNYDGSRIREVVSNLVFNAARYGQTGTTIGVRLVGAPDRLDLAVENAGPSIPVSELEALFEPLRRGGQEAGMPTERTSLGLGLFIVQEIARAHGGKVAATSKDGKTTFTMTIPTAA